MACGKISQKINVMATDATIAITGLRKALSTSGIISNAISFHVRRAISNQCGFSRIVSRRLAPLASAWFPLCVSPVKRPTSRENTHKTSPAIIPAKQIRMSTISTPMGAGMVTDMPKEVSLFSTPDLCGETKKRGKQ